MEIKQLECFLAVAEERHFTKAARRLNLVQSGLSQTIRALEDELGGPLFVRTTRHVGLTPAGEVLLKEAARVVSAAREARFAVTQVHGLARGQLRIGSIQSLYPFVDLPRSLAKFRESYPGIDVQLMLDGAAPLLELLDEGRFDIVFAAADNLTPGCTSRMLACESLVLTCAPTHPLSKTTLPSLKDLCNYPFVDLKADWGMRRMIDRLFLSLGSTRNIAFEVNDVSMLLDLVARGLGIALLPESVAERGWLHEDSNIVGVELKEDEALCWELVVGFKGQGGSPSDRLTEAFLELMVSANGDPVQYQLE